MAVLLVVLVVMVGAAAAVWWPSSRVDLPEQPPLEAVELSSLPAAQAPGRAADQLRWYLTLDRSRMVRWRALPDPARHLLVLSAVEGAEGITAHPFKGIAATADNGTLSFTVAELVDAYRAIGAKACAAVAEEAGKASGDAKRLADCDRRLIAASAQDKAITLLAAYVLQHADELAAVWAKP
ncbi:MAG: hypothetical protein L6R48_00080 [Planctomycetes bacterium]|nr:hypothetical protein [Planctomycetota bacterium]